MADVKWIKIVTDIFDDEKMLLIESMPSADSIIVIWFKLLCLAGKNNNRGVFMLNDTIAYTDEMLATIFRRDVNTIRLALKTFEGFGMVELIDNVITIPNWSKHQNLDQIEERKEYMRKYMSKYRSEQKALIDGKSNRKVNSKSNRKVNVSALEREEELEEERELEEEKRKDIVASRTDAAFENDSFEMLCVNTIINSCLDQLPGSKVPSTEKEKYEWCVHIDRMRRIDKRSEEDIRTALEYAVTDNFWKSNIRSTKKFRDKFETLIVQARTRKLDSRQSVKNRISEVDNW